MSNVNAPSSPIPMAQTDNTPLPTNKYDRQIALLNRQVQKLIKLSKELPDMGVKPEDVKKQQRMIQAQIAQLLAEISRIQQQKAKEERVTTHVLPVSVPPAENDKNKSASKPSVNIYA